MLQINLQSILMRLGLLLEEENCYCVCAKDPNDSLKISSIDYEYSIDSLSKWAGFKIIKTSENSFKRKPKE